MIKCKVNFRDNLIAASDMSPSYFNKIELSSMSLIINGYDC